MISDIPLRLSSLILACFCCCGEVEAQVLDSLRPIQDSLVWSRIDSVPPFSDLDTTSVMSKSRPWKYEIGCAVSKSDVYGLECSYRQLLDTRGIEFSLMYFSYPVQKEKYFIGQIQNQFLEYKADTSSNIPYRRIKGNWRTVEGVPFAPAPTVLTTNIIGTSIGVPFFLFTKTKRLGGWVAPGLGLFRHTYLRIEDEQTNSEASSTLFVYGEPPYTVRVEEHTRAISQLRSMTRKTDYLPFLSYSAGMRIQVSHRLAMEISYQGVFQPRDYNEVNAISLVRDISGRAKFGVVYRINPEPRPQKVLPALERDLIRI